MSKSSEQEHPKPITIPINAIVHTENPIYSKFWIIRKNTELITANSQTILKSAETPLPNGEKCF